MEVVALEYADEVRPRSKDFLIALEGLVNFAAGLNGRKSVLAVTHGTATEPREELLEAFKAKLGDSEDLNSVLLAVGTGEGTGIQLDRLLDYAVSREVTLSIIDRTLEPPGVSSARSGELFTPGTRPISVAYRQPQVDSQIIARTTGGIFVHDDDLGAGLKKAIDAERGAYSVGVYLDYYLPRDRLSKISVDTTRSGVTIHHQRGTYAAQLRPGAKDLLRGNISLGRQLRVPTDPDRLKIPFRIEAEARDLGYNRSEDYAMANFTVHVEVETEDGRVAADSYHLVSHAYPWTLWAEGDIEPVQIGGWLEVPTGTFKLVASFSNPRQDISGKLERPITVASQKKNAEGAAP